MFSKKEIKQILGEFVKVKARKFRNGFAVTIEPSSECADIELLNKVGLALHNSGFKWQCDLPGESILSTRDAWTAFNGGVCVNVLPK